jgi:hypothetical protein
MTTSNHTLPVASNVKTSCLKKTEFRASAEFLYPHNK